MLRNGTSLSGVVVGACASFGLDRNLAAHVIDHLERPPQSIVPMLPCLAFNSFRSVLFVFIWFTSWSNRQ